jgi:hypothetical protein
MLLPNLTHGTALYSGRSLRGLVLSFDHVHIYKSAETWAPVPADGEEIQGCWA